MSFNIGVNVLEVEGTASPSVVAAPVSTAGFLVRSERGIPNRPTHVRSFGDFVTYFGSYRKGLFGAHALSGFFQNGGADAWVVRIVGAPANAATATLNSSAGPVALNLTAGMLGLLDPGDWGNSLSVRVDDSPQGTTQLSAQILSANAEPFALANNNAISVTVDGAGPPVVITFQTADFANIAQATAAEVAAVIDRAAPSLRAVATPGHRVLLSSATPGTASRIAVAAPPGPLTDAGAALGFTGANANSDQGILAASSTLVGVQSIAGFEIGSAVRIDTRGRIVAPNAIGPAPVFPAGIDVTVDGGAAVPVRFAAAPANAADILATIRAQAAGFSVDRTADGRFVLMSNSFGSGSSIAIAAPPAAPPGIADATAWLGFGGAVAAAGNRQTKVITQVLESERLVGWATPLAAALDPAFAQLRTIEFRLQVFRGTNTTALETWDGLSMQENVPNYVLSVLNDADAGSRYITAADPNAGAVGVKATPAPATTPFGGGSETAPLDAAWVGDAASRTGLFAFDTTRIQLLATPETQSAGVVSAALTYCEERGDAMFVGTAPLGYDADGIKTYAGPFRAKKVYGALYSPWIRIANPLDTTNTDPMLYVPPVGHVLGVYARIAASGGVWRAPAGDDAVINLALGTEFPMTDADLTDLVENGSVNGIRAVPGSGIVIDSSRTLSTDTRWWYVNVRRLFNFVKVSLRDSLRFVAQEPHDEALRRRVKFNVVTPFLMGLWSQGAFGSDPAEQVFTVKCDASNNPPAEVQQGRFTLEVFFYPVKPAEKIIITVGQQDSGAAASES
jgi:phage tail sheath protein FI